MRKASGRLASFNCKKKRKTKETRNKQRASRVWNQRKVLGCNCKKQNLSRGGREKNMVCLKSSIKERMHMRKILLKQLNIYSIQKMPVTEGTSQNEIAERDERVI